ncbi:Alpha carbonic anhydrase, partial [Trinorchestia longiramus]
MVVRTPSLQHGLAVTRTVEPSISGTLHHLTFPSSPDPAPPSPPSPPELPSLLPLSRHPEGIGISWDWGKWWTYTGISGPKFWGLINPEWSLCTHGRRQSPVDLQPHLLLHDPNLGPLHVDKQLVRGHLSNTGHSVVFIVDTGSGTFNNDGPSNIKQNFSAAAREKDESRSPFETDKEREGRKTSGGHFNSEEGGRDSSSSGPFDRMPQDALMTGHRRTTENDVRHGRFDNAHVDADVSHRKEKIVAVNIIGGPLSYKYQVSHIQFHFGTGDGPGSEHTVNGSAFRAEMQVYGFNAQLYNNFSEAVTRPHGAAAIAVLIQVGVRGHPGLSSLMDALPRVRWAGEAVWVSSVSINDVLPHTQHYMTYEGSLTQPPCHETVTWIVMNKPVYVTRLQ